MLKFIKKEISCSSEDLLKHTQFCENVIYITLHVPSKYIPKSTICIW